MMKVLMKIINKNGIINVFWKKCKYINNLKLKYNKKIVRLKKYKITNLYLIKNIQLLLI